MWRKECIKFNVFCDIFEDLNTYNIYINIQCKHSEHLFPKLDEDVCLVFTLTWSKFYDVLIMLIDWVESLYERFVLNM